MGRRLLLHQLLINTSGIDHVYFQPPETLKMEYPCIVYKRTSAITRFANDFPYLCEMRYQVIVIDPNPDSEIPEKIAALQKCVFDRHYTADNLNHDVYEIYY